jgi:uncharacterized membrane protein YdjX (TVP38/TMEM64 family)
MTAVRVLLIVILVAAIVAAAVGWPVTQWLVGGASWAERHRSGAGALFVAAYTLAAVLVVPGTLLSLVAGFVFGLPLGIVLVSAGSVLGAAAAFLVGRFVARDWVAKRVGASPRFHALDHATRHDAFMIVLLARLSPLFPYNLLNYAFGLTQVRLRDYVLASWLGMLPVTVLYVYIGSLTKGVAALTGGDLTVGWPRHALLVVGFVATVLLAVVIARRARQALRDRLATEERSAPETGA